MRQGELLGLRWRDVDWGARRISVHHTLVRMHGRWWLGDPKTPKSERSVTPWGSKTRIRSCGEPVVLADEPAEEIPPADVARVDRDRLCGRRVR